MKRLFQNETFLIILILFVAFLVRLYKINTPLADWHSWRQADTASVTRTYVERGINLLFPRYQDISSIQTGINNPEGYRFVEFPIYNALHALLTKYLPGLSLEVWGRLLSTICSLISVYLVFLLGRRFIGKFGGIMAAFFFAFLPYNIFFSRVILPEPMAVTLGLLALYFFVRFLDRDMASDLYLSAAFFCFSLLVKPFTVFYSVPMFYLLVDKFGFKAIFKNGRLLIKLLTFTNIILIPLLLWRFWISLYPAGMPFFTWAFNGDHIRFRPAFWRWIFGERLGRLILGIWGLVPFSLGVIYTGKASLPPTCRQGRAGRKNFFVQFFLLGMFLFVSIVATANVRHDYYQIFTIPAISLALAAGANYLIKTKELSKWLARGLLIFSIGMMLGFAFYDVRDYYNINHPEIIEAGVALDKIAPKDALVVAPYNGDTAFLYQTKRWGWPAIDTNIDDIIARGADYYVSVNFDDQTNSFMRRFKTLVRTPKYVILNLHEEIK